jgi:hypothetical protein
MITLAQSLPSLWIQFPEALIMLDITTAGKRSIKANTTTMGVKVALIILWN